MTKLQNVELDIVKKIIQLCEKHNIKYYIVGGTLLGAVRHKGFIPWDDDIDIAMLRPDYEKFIDIAQKELPENLILDYYQLHKNEPSYNTYYMARVENSKVKLITRVATEKRTLNAWVDIFPLDGLPNNSVKCFFHKLKLLYLRAALRYSQYSRIVTENAQNKDAFMRLLIKIGKVINFEKIYNKDKVLEKIDKSLKKYPCKDSKEIINFAGACKSYKFIELFPKRIYDEIASYQFEDTYLKGPKDYNYVLTHHYGDYMTPPSDENKNKHQTEVIEEE